MKYLEFTQWLWKNDWILAVDYYFAELVTRMAGAGKDSPVLLLAALASQAVNCRSDVCVPLDQICTPEKLAFYLGLEPDAELPELPENWIRAVTDFPHVFSEGERMTPLIIRNGLLYLAGSYRAEQKVLNIIQKKVLEMNPNPPVFDPAVTSLKMTAGQEDAIRKALRSNFMVISGGPGTGKTTIISVLLALRSSAEDRILLCAPTGKAQARMCDALREEVEQHLNCSAETKKRLNLQASTIHSLLKVDPSTGKFKHNHDNPLDCSILVVDECSMASLPLMASLLDAVPPEAVVILLGDRAQLASVESGKIFADICDFLGEHPENIAVLTESRRFDPDEGIGKLQALIQSGNVQNAWAYLAGNTNAQLICNALPAVDELENFLQSKFAGWIENGKGFQQEETLDQAWERFEKLRILSPVNSGDYSTEMLNDAAEKILGIKKNSQGQTCLIRRNDYQLHLMNGDIGMFWYADELGHPLPANETHFGKRCLVFFKTSGEQGNTVWRGIDPALLPQHDRAYAISIHKSQGSGYERILMFLPELNGLAESLLTRELVYTGITRAKKCTEVVCSQKSFTEAVNRVTIRYSGFNTINQGS